MKNYITITTLVFSIAYLLFSSPVAAMTGREIAEENFKLKEPDSEKSSAQMLIYKKGKVNEKEFTYLNKKIGKNSRSLISFYKPTKIKLLSHSYEGKDDDQWLRLSSGRVKRITSSNKGRAFVKSHFSYEDMQKRYIDDNQYEYLGEKSLKNTDCYLVKSVRIRGKSSYEKTISYYRKSDFFILKTEYYQKGKLVKALENLDLKNIDGVITPLKRVMYKANSDDKTELKAKNIRFNTNIRNSSFSKASLK